MRSNRLLAALLGLAVALCVAGLAYWRLAPIAPPEPPLPDPVALDRPATLESALPALQRQADAWLPGAVPMQVTLQVDWPWEVAPGPVAEIPGTGWVTAVFAAPWDAPFGRKQRAATLGLLYERLSGQIVAQDSVGWETPPGARGPWVQPRVDSTGAGLAAERAGGTRFRAACPDQRHLSRTMLVDPADGGGWPRHWLVTYQDARDPAGFGLLVRIDAETGTPLETRDTAPPCPGSEPPAG